MHDSLEATGYTVYIRARFENATWHAVVAYSCHADCPVIDADSMSFFVPTVETTRLNYLLELLLPNMHHVMFVGNSGKCRKFDS